MSPREFREMRRHLRFPRVSGDEPLPVAIPMVEPSFSPRERG